ncbi:flagellar protein FlaG [Brevibacillus dissolubilis]|uniref:flagellar protein FlaG n=1 Tax=Brevibacillus dissolubilis TaxID=1844116 RepID=UPI001117882A|nr:flagellar protein FlaG [Brevibacillus dissolubilis]
MDIRINSNGITPASFPDQAPTPQPSVGGTGQVETGAEEAKAAIADKALMRSELEAHLPILNKWLTVNNSHLKFTYHEKLNEYYVQIVNEHDEVVREIPSRKMMDTIAKMYEMIGLLVDKKL